MKKILAILVLSLFSACTHSTSPVTYQEAVSNAGQKPTNTEVESIVKEYLGSTLKDPSSVIQLRISEAVPGVIDNGLNILGERLPIFKKAWTVCYELNAKNSYGAYTGLEKKYVGIKNKQIVDGGNKSMLWMGLNYCDKNNAKWIELKNNKVLAELK